MLSFRVLFHYLFAPLVVVLAVAASAEPPVSKVDKERLANIESEPENWLLHGRTYDEQRFSPLTQINTDTVDDLGLAWYFETGTLRGIEATPIVVDGRMYVSGPWSVVFALDAKTGEKLWYFDPEVDKSHGFHACCDVVNRGVAVWGDRVFVGTIDGRLIAIDASDGQKVWDVPTIDPGTKYTITGAPRVFDGKVLIGNGGAEFGVRGYVTAYDAADGSELWRFYTVPGNPADGFESDAMADAAKTWTGEWWKQGGGGTAYDAMVYDAELHQLYIGVGNGSPWNSYMRSPDGGDNLYLSSIVALNPDTGAYLWHYQQTPGERWDYTATQHIMLADLTIGGEQRPVLMQAPKNGFFYVLDRRDGKLISADPFVRVNWASHIDLESGRPVFTETANYRDKSQFTLPGPTGAHNWHSMAYHPEHQLVYIPALDQGFEFRANNDFLYEGGAVVGVDLAGERLPSLFNIAAQRSTHFGSIVAWDPVARQPRWRIEHEKPWSMSLLATAGNLIFQGSHDGWLKAWTADSGNAVWQAKTQIAAMAAPVSYSVDGEQYIAVAAGWGGAMGNSGGVFGERTGSKGRVLAFKLGAKTALPPAIAAPVLPAPPTLTATDAELDEGARLYGAYCARCHGLGARSGGGVPDLRYMDKRTHEIFPAIVFGGIYSDRGMVGFSKYLSLEQTELIHQYIVSEAAALQEQQAEPAWWYRLKLWFFGKLIRFAS
jgi:quinohemoprotein ethanol dehydrogenase